MNFLLIAALLSISLFTKALADSVCNCVSFCSLVPPKNVSSAYPCYQGSITDAIDCYENDPFIQPGTTWTCETCAQVGYPQSKGYDPIYTNMSLWGKSKR